FIGNKPDNHSSFNQKIEFVQKQLITRNISFGIVLNDVTNINNYFIKLFKIDQSSKTTLLCNLISKLNRNTHTDYEFKAIQYSFLDIFKAFLASNPNVNLPGVKELVTDENWMKYINTVFLNMSDLSPNEPATSPLRLANRPDSNFTECLTAEPLVLEFSEDDGVFYKIMSTSVANILQGYQNYLDKKGTINEFFDFENITFADPLNDDCFDKLIHRYKDHKIESIPLPHCLIIFAGLLTRYQSFTKEYNEFFDNFMQQDLTQQDYFSLLFQTIFTNDACSLTDGFEPSCLNEFSLGSILSSDNHLDKGKLNSLNERLKQRKSTSVCYVTNADGTASEVRYRTPPSSPSKLGFRSSPFSAVNPANPAFNALFNQIKNSPSPNKQKSNEEVKELD
ncbi:MAG: hypothetical protein VW397_05535, partial [Candidatus Margulisiibacteriota bacterium]